MASSSAHLNHHHQPSEKHGGPTAAPPPTPSCPRPNTSSNPETAVDALSSLFHRLPPLLARPNRRFSDAYKSSIATLPKVSLSAGGQENWDDLISAATEFGYFQLTIDDSDIVVIPNGLAEEADSDALKLLALSEEKKESSFPKNWPLGYEADAETPSFCLDADCSTESSELKLSSLREFTRTLEKVGLKTVEMLGSALGFGNDSTRFNTLMWLNQNVHRAEPEITNGYYPFVVCLQYQIREEKHCLLTESGWLSVLPRVDSVLVTLGDIAQVWSNGGVKRVQYRPVLCLGQNDGPRKLVTMTLMLTLPMDTMVSPLKDMISDGDKEEEEEEDGGARSDERRAFRSFRFEEYALRLYRERLFFRDPLDRYRIKC